VQMIHLCIVSSLNARTGVNFKPLFSFSARNSACVRRRLLPVSPTSGQSSSQLAGMKTVSAACASITVPTRHHADRAQSRASKSWDLRGATYCLRLERSTPQGGPHAFVTAFLNGRCRQCRD
jgi:hypothetical protein